MPLTQVPGGMIAPGATITSPIIPATMGVGGATPSASGAGITFPATQSASSNANTLDDYEEGTWTPSFIGLSVTGDSSVGNYTRIGQIVYLNFYIQFAKTGATGDFGVTGLPYPMKSGPDQGSGSAITYNVSTPGNNYVWRRYNDTTIGILSGNAGSTWGWTAGGAFSTGLSAIAGQFYYIAA